MKRIRIEMTGSPKPFGFKTKEEFIEALTPFNVFATKITHSPDFLITNSLESETRKMARAKSEGIPVLTYGQLIDKYRVEMRKKKLEEIRIKMSNR
jgi:hypothetical protein